MITQLNESAGQVQTVNELTASLVAYFLFTIDYRQSVALTVVITGGRFKGTGGKVTVADQTFTVGASATTYFDAHPATGVIAAQTGAYTSGRVPIGFVTTNTEGRVSWTQDFINAP